jgi:hypothetical protein
VQVRYPESAVASLPFRNGARGAVMVVGRATVRVVKVAATFTPDAVPFNRP